MTETQSTLSRRTFVKGSLAGLAATGAAGTALFGCAPQSGTGAGEEPMAATGEETAPDEIHWSQCNVNCGRQLRLPVALPRWQSALHGDR